MEKKSTPISGIEFFISLLTVAFIVLKILGVISWPWVWVLSPLWGAVALGIFIVCIIVFVALIREQKKKKR